MSMNRTTGPAKGFDLAIIKTLPVIIKVLPKDQCLQFLERLAMYGMRR
jgi:hypothetical protein